MTLDAAADVQILDCVGKACPVPVIELAKAVAAMAPGQEIVVLSDDPGAKVDIPVWCRMKQQRLVSVETEGSLLRFRVAKTT